MNQSASTPLMIQYQQIKDRHPGEVLFFRLGDFYEMFNDDAVEVSRLLNLTLTQRGGNPMCGVPFHAAKIYIARLLRLGKRIAVCEQTSLPTAGKGLAERKVVEVITPGTTVEEDYLERGVHNYLAAVCADEKKTVVSFAWLDISTAAFAVTSWKYADTAEQFARELGRVQPRELLLSASLENHPAVVACLDAFPDLVRSVYPDWHFAPAVSYKRLVTQFKTANLRAFSLTEQSPETGPAGFLLDYASKNAASDLPQITGISRYEDGDFVIMDDSSRKNLEIVSNLRDGGGAYTLFEVVNRTVTPLGSRMLRNWLLWPLASRERIQNRQSQIQSYVEQPSILKTVRVRLKPILDVERLACRIAMDRAHAKDLQALRASLAAFLSVREAVIPFGFGGVSPEQSAEVIKLIEDSILDDPSIFLTEGKIIRRGWSEHLDHLYKVQSDFSAILDAYLEEEKAKTGIQNLKIRYNRLTGYYIEVTRGKLDSVPGHFIKRRSLVNGDRYTTERLEDLERELSSADEKIIAEEKRLFLEIRGRLQSYTPYLLSVAAEIAHMDTIASLAQTAIDCGWACPRVQDSPVLEITQGRHPVVEYHLPSGEFVPNDTLFGDKTFALITGPNMAGKSTYLRQTALIVLLAQTGSFVPAKSAEIGLVDRVFCRVGASDNLARGESTFLTEMVETAHILRSATERSLVIMDEVGRGTSTEDGLSIAWAVSEHLLNVIRAKTLFATHYHELSRLSHPSLLLLCLDVLEQEGQVVFLNRVRPGASENSYGLHVARLAGIPQSVVDRAYQVLESVQKKSPYTEPPETSGVPPSNETAASHVPGSASLSASSVQSPGLFSDEELVLDEILSLDPDGMTPLEALQRLARWKKTLSGRA